ncbi:tripartite tricarboxylate transporter TctB family protein [Streptomyces xiaopingdaonensis]|uniref:tripartite tricarboxylate transporter TctB family protein n=1 Tax=Streptomyces xiaopingdaonensis TaxID=1565415 RepID=UPI0003629D8B|nr:tripartite tricarboxylate transporter TctB family protein [Streptomyces xiaopingdaonensis]
MTNRQNPAQPDDPAETTEPPPTAGDSGTTEPSGADPTPDADPAPAPEPAHDPETVPWTGRTAWVFPGLVALFGAVAVRGALTIEAPPHSPPPGPGVVPGIVGTLLLLVAARMALVNLRVARRIRQGAQVPGTPGVDWPPVGIIVLTLAVHVALLEPLGWLLSGALLFWGVAYAFGARTWVRDALVSLSMSAAVQVGFSLGLGLNLPGGVLELVL